MPSMTKRVNVQTRVAVRNTNPPIYGSYSNIVMTTGDILKCLIKKATIDEILPDGSTVRLNFKNYYTDNGAGLDAKAKEQTIVPKQPKPAIEFNKEENITKTELPKEEDTVIVVDDKINVSDEVAVDAVVETEVAETVVENADTAEDVTVDTTVEDVKEDTVEASEDDIIVDSEVPLATAQADVEVGQLKAEDDATDVDFETAEENTSDKEEVKEAAPKKTTTTAKKKTTNTSKKK